MSVRAHTEYLAAFTETGSAAHAATKLGCTRRTIYNHLRRAGIRLRPWQRKAPYLRLVAKDSFTDWQAVRMRAIDVELGRLRAEWERLLTRAVRR